MRFLLSAFLTFCSGIIAFGQSLDDLHFSVGLDLYYAYDFNKPFNHNRQYVTEAARHNEFNLNWGFIKANFDNDKIRANLAFQTGTYPIFNYTSEPSDILKMIAEANAGIRLTNQIWLEVGIMPSHIGYEKTFTFNNEMYTQALMTELTPYFNTGIQLSAAVNDQLDLKLLILNGWQNIAETNNGKSAGIQVNYRPVDGLELNYSNYIGNESTLNDQVKLRIYNNFYAKYYLEPNWHVTGSFDFGRQELLNSTEWGNVFSIMVLTQYEINENFNIAARIEHFNDKNEILMFTGMPNGFTNTNFGVTIDYMPVDFVKCRIEAMSYTSPDDIYNAGPTDSQNTFLLVGSIAVNLQ